MNHLIAQATQPAAWLTPEMVTALVALIGAIGAAIVGVIAALRGTSAKAQGVANSASIGRQSDRMNRIESDQKTIALHTPAPARPVTPHDPPTFRPPSPLLLLPLLLTPLFFGCVADSQSYKALVHDSYPTVANRMERYDLSDTERQDVQTLRTVSADRAKVTYTTARPAWEAVAPSYRGHVAADEKLSPFVKNEWQLTADKLDAAQNEEAKYRKTLFGGGQ